MNEWKFRRNHSTKDRRHSARAGRTATRRATAIESLEKRLLMTFEGSTIGEADDRFSSLATTLSYTGEIFTLADNLDVDIFKVSTLTRGDTFTIAVNGDVSANPLNSVLRLFRSNGTEIDNDRPLNSNDSSITWRVDTTATYYFGISGSGNGSYNPNNGSGLADGDEGGYHVTVTRTPNSPPAVFLDGSAGTENDGQANAFFWDASDADGIATNGGYLHIWKDGVGDLYNGTVSPGVNIPGGFSLDPYGPGTYHVYFTATDNYGTTSPGTSRDVTIVDDDTSGPGISLSAVGGSHNRANNINWSVSDPSGVAWVVLQVWRDGTLVYSQNVGASGSLPTESWGLGNYQATVTAADSDGDWSGDSLTSSATIFFSVTNSAPVANNDSYSVNEDPASPLSINVLANDTDPDIFPGDNGEETRAATLLTSPTLGTLTPTGNGTYSYTPFANRHGSDSFTYQVTDKYGAVSGIATVFITINPVNDAPAFTKGSNQTVDEDAAAQSLPGWATAITPGPFESGQTVHFVLSNNNNPLFSVQPAIAPDGTLTYTPASNAYGTATVTVFLADDGGTASSGTDTSASQTFTITVSPINDPPTLDPVGDRQVDELANISFSLSASDIDSAVLTYSAAGLPDGATFDTATGAFSWTPTELQDGAYLITFYVSDGAATDSETITLTVNEVNTDPSIEAGADARVAAGTTFSRDLLVIDPDNGDSWTASIDWHDGTIDHPAVDASGHFTLSHVYATPGVYSVTVTISDATGATPAIDSFQLTAAGVVGRYIFYNRSSFDGNNAAANTADDNAIATDKVALRRGQKATFANYTSYSRGINGIMIDLVGLDSNPSAADFAFAVGNTNTPNAWAAAPAPISVTRRPGAGANGSDRVTLIWADNAIQKTWLEARVLNTAVTGLASPDIFYFGNAIGEAGDSAANAIVNATDELLARVNPTVFPNKAAITNPYDFDRDGKVDATDQLLARVNATNLVTALKLIDLTAFPPPSSLVTTSFGSSLGITDQVLKN